MFLRSLLAHCRDWEVIDVDLKSYGSRLGQERRAQGVMLLAGWEFLLSDPNGNNLEGEVKESTEDLLLSLGAQLVKDVSEFSSDQKASLFLPICLPIAVACRLRKF